MSGTHTVVMGDRGRLVVPAELRERLGLRPGTVVVLLDGEHGVVMVTQEQLERLVRRDLAGTDLIDDLLDDRRRQAAADDAA
jgi:AbrB family looped-hinge helix DNA binding protein